MRFKLLLYINPAILLPALSVKWLQELGKMRRERDSNPWYSCPHNGFRDRPIQPLWHPSVEHKFKKQPFVSVTAQKNQPQNEAGWRRERDSNPTHSPFIYN